MEKVTWVIENSNFSEDLMPLTEEIKRQGHKVIFIKYYDFICSQFHESLSGPIIAYGTINLIKEIQRQRLSWCPGYFADFDKYKCSQYYYALGGHLLNDDYYFLPFCEINRRKAALFEMFGEDKLFIRPDSGLKTFNAGPVIGADFSSPNFGNLWFSDKVNPNTLCVIASHKNIDREIRFIIADNEIITASQYKNRGEIGFSTDIPPEAIEKAKQIILSRYAPDRIYIMDLAEYQGDWYLLELNAFSTSGFYSCDLEKIVSRVSKIAQEEFDLQND